MDRDDHAFNDYDWETAGRSDHLFSPYDFMDRNGQSAMPRSVSPTSCPPGVSPALEAAYDIDPAALRAPALPSFATLASERPTTRPPRR